MTYEAWRISYQSSEQAARAAYAECDELRSKIETTEYVADHQKALADSALRVAEGWEIKCGELRAALQHEADCVEAAKAEIEALRAKIAEMERQEPVTWRTFDGEGGYDYRSYEDNENYKLGWDARNPNHIGWVEPLYALPGAQPAPSIPVEAIGKMLADVMAVAVSNGANSVSMPDEYVEVAVWLQGECPTQPAPSVPEGWKLVPRPPTPTMVKAGLESSHVLNVHRVLACYDAMIDAAPEAKP